MSLVFNGLFIMKKFLLFIILIISSKNILANIVLQGTRIIYYEAKGNVTVQLTNNGKLPALVQSWVDDGNINSTPEKSHSPFYVFPPIVKIAGLKGQQLKIKMISHKLPKNRESVFYLNILDIPPYPENTQGKSVLQLAIKSRVKLFYRPKELTTPPADVYKKISYKLEDNDLIVTNNSKYYFTIAKITHINEAKKSLIKSKMIPPLSDFKLPLQNKVKHNKLTVTYVDDFGVYKTRNINLK